MGQLVAGRVQQPLAPRPGAGAARQGAGVDDRLDRGVHLTRDAHADDGRTFAGHVTTFSLRVLENEKLPQSIESSLKIPDGFLSASRIQLDQFFESRTAADP